MALKPETKQKVPKKEAYLLVLTEKRSLSGSPTTRSKNIYPLNHPKQEAHLKVLKRSTKGPKQEVHLKVLKRSIKGPKQEAHRMS